MILTQTSCQKNSTTNIVVVAVDGISAADISCTQTVGARSGFAALCEDSVRFTHAFTTSPMSAPAMASLLTGLYPFQSGLRHNGSPGLAMSLQSAAESAVEKKYRTGFFSGGAPIFRKTGLNQGFEFFDDGLIPTPQQIFRPFKKSLEIFDSWLTQDVKREPFMAVFYVPDLVFTDTVTMTLAAETRSRTFESQLEELDGHMAELIRLLKKHNLWRETVFIFTGLNGRVIYPRTNEIPPLNLHLENTQIPVFIKPPQKIRDINLHWTVDQNISLADVGMTIFDILGDTLPVANGKFPAKSLKSSITKVDNIANDERALLIESGWAQWKKLGPVRAAVIRNQDYFIFDESFKYYNLLTDRFETNPLLPSKAHSELTAEVSAALSAAGYRPFNLKSDLIQEKLSIPYGTWINPGASQELQRSLSKLHKDHPQDSEIANWLAEVAFENKDAKTYGEILAKFKLPPLSLGEGKDPCWTLTGKIVTDPTAIKNCPESLFRDLVTWLKADAKDPQKDFLKNKFARAYQTQLTDRKIFKSNLGLYQIWDLNPELSLKPNYTDIFLNRPENLGLRLSVLKSLPQTPEEF